MAGVEDARNSFVELAIVIPPPSSHLGFGEAEIIGRRHKRERPLDRDEDYRLDPFVCSLQSRFEEKHSLIKLSARSNNCGCAFEAKSLAADWIDDVDFDVGVLPEVPDRVRAADVGEDQRLIVPNSGCAFGGEVWRSIGADRRHMSKPLFVNEPLHFGCQYWFVRTARLSGHRFTLSTLLTNSRNAALILGGVGTSRRPSATLNRSALPVRKSSSYWSRPTSDQSLRPGDQGDD